MRAPSITPSAAYLAGLATAGVFPSTVRIDSLAETPDALGTPQEAFAPFLSDLSARISPASSRENRTEPRTYGENERFVTLATHQPTIRPSMRAVVTAGPGAGVTYDLVAVDADGNGTMTRLRGRILA